MKKVIAGFLKLFLAFSAQAQEVNPIDLASILLRDKLFDKAKNELRDFKPKGSQQTFKYNNIMGLIQLGLTDYKSALNYFDKSLKFLEKGDKDTRAKNKEKREQLYLYVAQTHYKLSDFEQAIAAMKKTSYRKQDRASSFLLVSSAYWRLGKKGLAIAELGYGEQAIPDSFEFTRQIIMYYIDLELYEVAYQKALAMLPQKNIFSRDLSAIGAAFKSKSQFEYSEKFLNASLLRFPLNEDILVELAHTYLKINKTLLAAETFEKASLVNKKYYAETVELYRTAGQHAKAFWLSQYIKDPKKRLKQVLAVQLEKENFGSIKTLELELSRKNLIKDQEVSYAMAYTYFRLGEYASAKKYLNRISQPELVKKAIALREGMSKCSQEGVWTCL